MNMKIIQYDIRAVWNENKVKYMVFAGFIIIACICCNHSCKKLLSVDMGFLGLHFVEFEGNESNP